MTKVVLLGDTHIGSRNANKTVEHWQQRFFDEVFFPYLEEHGIKRVIQLGDLYDNRRFLPINAVSWFNEKVIKRLSDLGVRMDAIIGNHDVFYKHTNTPNSPELMLSHYDHINIYTKPTKFTIDDVDFTMIPWMCRENYDECLSVIKDGGDICVGHFDIQGFVMHPGAVSKEGLHLSDFQGWNTVWSGHYHTQSQNQNVHYLGTPYQMNWSDATTKQGFWVFDTTDRSLEFVENKLRYFHRFYWNDGCEADLTTVTQGYVKVNVQKKSDFEAFELFIDQINFNSPFELKVIESYEEFNQENVQDLIDLSSTEDLIEEYIDEVATTTNKDNVKHLMLSIYQEAMSIEE